MEYTKGERTIYYGARDFTVGIKAPNFVHIGTFKKLSDAQLDVAAPVMYEALNNLPEPKSILADAAYTGGDVPKSWIRDRGNFNDGYNQALKDVSKMREQVLAKTKGK